MHDLNRIQVTVDLNPVIAPLLKRIEALEKENERLKKSLSEWIKPKEAYKLGFTSTTLYTMRRDGRLRQGVDWKAEGKAIWLNRTSLEKLNEGQEVKRKRLTIPV
jgi:hypothetical protein